MFKLRGEYLAFFSHNIIIIIYINITIKSQRENVPIYCNVRGAFLIVKLLQSMPAEERRDTIICYYLMYKYFKLKYCDLR